MSGEYWSAAPTAPAPALSEPSVGTWLLLTRLRSTLLPRRTREPIIWSSTARSDRRLKSEFWTTPCWLNTPPESA
jgi:hypothetical protein